MLPSSEYRRTETDEVCFEDGEETLGDVPGEIHEGLACYEQDACVCDPGSSAEHVGTGDTEAEEFYDYIQNWDPDAGCRCVAD